MGLGIRGWRRVGLGKCKVGGVGSRSNHTPWNLCSAVRTILNRARDREYKRALRDRLRV